MSGVLDRLALRAIGALPVVRPVPPPRFAAAPLLAPSPPPAGIVPEPPRSVRSERCADAPAAHDLGAYLEARRSGSHERL